MIKNEEQFWESFEKMSHEQRSVVAYAIENPQFGKKVLAELRAGKEKNENKCTCRT